MSSATKQAGFTIIETMLFVGITGLIMAFMLVGVSTQLNHRRYQDASNSLLSYVQSQYNLVSNVNSARSASEVCIDHQVKAAETGDENDAGRGTSDCTIVGRLLRSVEGGTGISSTQVIATVDAASLPLQRGDSDTKVLQDARLTTGLNVDQYSTQWNTKLVRPAPNGDQAGTFSILITRMPTTGLIHTYANTSATISLDELVDTANLVDFKLCLDPNGLLGLASEPTGTLIRADAASTGSIEFVSQGEC